MAHECLTALQLRYPELRGDEIINGVLTEIERANAKNTNTNGKDAHS